MAGGVEGTGAYAASISVNPQGDLLGHRPRRHEERRRLAQDYLYLILKRGYRPALPIAVYAQIDRNLSQQLNG